MKSFKEFLSEKSFGKTAVKKMYKKVLSVTNSPKIGNPVYLIKRKIKSPFYTPKPK